MSLSVSVSLSVCHRRWAIGVMLGMMVSGGVSGGHLNPAITVAVASVGKFPWWKVSDWLLNTNADLHDAPGSSLHGGAVPGLAHRLPHGVPGLLGQPGVV